MRGYRFAHIVAGLTLVCLLAATYAVRQGFGDRRNLVITGGAAHVASTDPTNEIEMETALKLFDYQLKSYQQALSALGTNLVLQLAFVVLGLLAIVSAQESFTVPVIGFEVPRSWLHFVVPIGSLYLWLQFGFLLDTLIESRSYAWGLMSAIGVASGEATFRGVAALFEDSGFMDAWFLLFRCGEHAIDETYVAATGMFFVVTFCVLLAATHAVIVAILCIGNERYAGAIRESCGRAAWLVAALPSMALALLVLSHLQFRFGGRNENWVQPVIVVMAVLMNYSLLYLSRARPGEEADWD